LKVLGIIPARRGSNRLERKNMHLLGGKPLMVWSIEAARSAKRLDRLVVSSDDPEVLDLTGRYDGVTPLPCPAELATDNSPAIDYVRHALAELEGAGQDRLTRL
jgi:CMP-N,N'-diacetyllegionaminic acid synthase